LPAAPKVAPVASPPAVPRTYLVFFDWDKADLKPEALVIVREVAANTDRIPVTRIQATGHADRSGPNKYNLELSRRRADAVRAELIRLGVSPGDIEILWKGEREPLGITAGGVREPQNRRVVISLQ
jgi:outer membrane protein OmpA-like peptidoglycan-associated protein